MASFNERLFEQAANTYGILLKKEIRTYNQMRYLTDKMPNGSSCVLQEVALPSLSSGSGKAWRSIIPKDGDPNGLAAARAEKYMCLSCFARSPSIEIPCASNMHYDFVLVTKNHSGKIKYHPIELNGIFHFQAIGDRRNSLAKRLLSDELKDLYCEALKLPPVVWLQCDEKESQLGFFKELIENILTQDEIPIPAAIQ